MLPSIEQAFQGKIINSMKMFRIGLKLDEIGLLQILIALTTDESLEFEIYPRELVGKSSLKKYETLRSKMDTLQAHSCIEYGNADPLEGRSFTGKKWKVKVLHDDVWSSEIKEKE